MKSRGAKGAMAPPQLKTCSNCHSKIFPYSDGTPGFENLMEALLSEAHFFQNSDYGPSITHSVSLTQAKQ